MSHPSLAIGRPESSEYGPFYTTYIGLVPGNDPVAALQNQLQETGALLRSISEERGLHRYAPGKWSIKETIQHLSDTERIITYRALRFARADKTELPGFEQDDYVKPSEADSRPLADLIEEFSQVRRSTLSMFRNFPHAAWVRTGAANGNTLSVRALAYIAAGHELNHVKILREKYLA